MQVNIQTVNNQFFRIKIDQAKPVKDLKGMIEKKEGIPIDNQILILNSVFLQDTDILGECINKNRQELLLIQKNKSLLLNKSKIFKNSTIIDRIHQSIIDLNITKSENDVLNLLIEAYAFLNNELDYETVSEIFSLIENCFSHFPKICSTTFDFLLEKSRTNTNYIFITASILTILRHNFPNINLDRFNSFVSEAFHQISKKISNFQDNIAIFGFKMHPKFQLNFVINIVSLKKMTDKIAQRFCTYIFQQEFWTQTNIIFLIKDIEKAGLKSFLPLAIQRNINVSNNELIKIIHEESKIIPINIQDSEVIIQYPKKNSFPTIDLENEQSFGNLIHIDNLIKNILKDSNIENNKKQFSDLFKLLIQDKTIAFNYFAIQFEKLIKYHKINIDNLIDNLHNWINSSHHDIFIESLHHFYAFDENGNVFIKRYNAKELPPSKIGIYTISKLLNEKCYQSYVCLKNIAACFPFIFESNSEHIFNIVLQAFDHFQNVFESENVDEKKNSSKIAIAALSFLYSSLYSTQVIQSFTFWVFENLLSFNSYQIYAISQILISLLQTNKVKYIVFSISLKYNFLENISQLLQRNIQNELLMNYYRSSLYEVLKNYYMVLSEISKGQFMIVDYSSDYSKMLIDQIKNLETPFQNLFNNQITIIPKQLSPINIRINNYTRDFMNKINENQSFWINNNSDNQYFEYRNANQNDENKLINDFKKLDNEQAKKLNTVEIPYAPYPYTIKMVRHLLSKPKWVFDWILRYKERSNIPEHRMIILKVVNELKEMQVPIRKRYNNKNEENLYYDNNFNIDFIILEQYCQQKLYKIIIKDAASLSSKANQTLCKLSEIITRNDVALMSFLDLISQYISKEYDENDLYSSSESIQKLINIIISISKNPAFNSNFFDLCGNKLFDIIMSPNYRVNIAQFTNSLHLLHCNASNKLNHVIGFMLVSNQSEIIPQALNLCSKIEKDELNNLMPIINQTFLREINDCNKINYSIKCFIDVFPKLAQKHKKYFYSLIGKLINDYCENLDEDNLNYICTLYNFLAPERDETQKISSNEEDTIDFSESITSKSPKWNSTSFSSSNQNLLIQPAPQVIRNQSPLFWDLYEKYRPFINYLIKNDAEIINRFKFLCDYYELIDFDVRSNVFRKKMKKRIDRYNYNYLTIRRQNVLSDSFDQLQSTQPKDYLNKLSIRFEGEYGVDAGGLTEDWFNLLSQEIFNPNYNLFKQLNSNSFQPSSSSYINGVNYIQYFKFAGRIIARALAGEHYIDAHLSMAFLRQILHRRPKFKDLEDYDEKLHESLKWILENDVDPLELVFTIDVNEFGEHKTIELKENGENIPVTNENKQEYVMLYTEYHLNKSIKKQIDAFCNGFNEIIPFEDIKIFSPSELDLLICGTPIIDIDDLRKNTTYESPYNSNHPVIILFFKVISKWDTKNLAKLLLFITGSSQVPINGFKAFKDRGNPIRIMSGGDRNRFPVSHTCFNIIALPQYTDENEMNDKLIQAIQYREFGIA